MYAPGDIAFLKVVEVNAIGAFLDWGDPKDLLLPFAEQTKRLNIYDEVIVAIYLDITQRPAASMKLNKFLGKETHELFVGQKVEIMIADKTDLGFKAIIEGKQWGLLYDNEIFQNLSYGQTLGAYISELRPDGKIDLNLNQTGHQAADKTADDILSLLKQNGGFLPINDKTEAEKIYQYFGVSKKKYKIALGGLYKQRLISINEKGIQLL